MKYYKEVDELLADIKVSDARFMTALNTMKTEAHFWGSLNAALDAVGALIVTLFFILMLWVVSGAWRDNPPHDQ